MNHRRHHRRTLGTRTSRRMGRNPIIKGLPRTPRPVAVRELLRRLMESTAR